MGILGLFLVLNNGISLSVAMLEVLPQQIWYSRISGTCSGRAEPQDQLATFKRQLLTGTCKAVAIASYQSLLGKEGALTPWTVVAAIAMSLLQIHSECDS
jgi:hypothetical protein